MKECVAGRRTLLAWFYFYRWQDFYSNWDIPLDFDWYETKVTLKSDIYVRMHFWSIASKKTAIFQTGTWRHGFQSYASAPTPLISFNVFWLNLFLCLSWLTNYAKISAPRIFIIPQYSKGMVDSSEKNSESRIFLTYNSAELESGHVLKYSNWCLI